jgi:hypothetical protein
MFKKVGFQRPSSPANEAIASQLLIAAIGALFVPLFFENRADPVLLLVKRSFWAGGAFVGLTVFLWSSKRYLVGTTFSKVLFWGVIAYFVGCITLTRQFVPAPRIPAVERPSP